MAEIPIGSAISNTGNGHVDISLQSRDEEVIRHQERMMLRLSKELEEANDEAAERFNTAKQQALEIIRLKDKIKDLQALLATAVEHSNSLAARAGELPAQIAADRRRSRPIADEIAADRDLSGQQRQAEPVRFAVSNRTGLPLIITVIASPQETGVVVSLQEQEAKGNG